MVGREVNTLTYKAVVSLQTSIPGRLERCWSQEPAILEDALGRVTPVHLEFLDCWEVSWTTLVVLWYKKSNTSRLSKPSSRFASENYQATERSNRRSMHSARNP